MNRTQRDHRGREALAALAALLLAVSLPAAAADRARVEVFSGGVDFLPEVAYREAVLTVAGDGKSYLYRLAPGERLSIGTFAPGGEPLADGLYKWELRLVPTEQAAERLRAEAAANGGQPTRPWTAQSGSFTIEGGRIADPTLVEPVAAPADRSSLGGGRAANLAVASPSARTAAHDVDGVGGRGGSTADGASSPAAPAALAPAAGSGLDDSDAVALSRPQPAASAAAASNTLSPQAAPRPDPSQDGANGRSPKGNRQ